MSRVAGCGFRVSGFKIWGGFSEGFSQRERADFSSLSEGFSLGRLD